MSICFVVNKISYPYKVFFPEEYFFNLTLKCVINMEIMTVEGKSIKIFSSYICVTPF